MAHSHIMYVTFKIFREAIAKLKCGGLKAVMSNLARTYALYEIMQDSSPLFETGFLKSGNAPLVLEAAKKVMVELRP
jgi:hypothetical protein